MPTNTSVTATSGTLTVAASVAYTKPYYYTVWIMNPSGTFLRTLAFYGLDSNYYKDMVNWSANTSKNLVNATTGATPSTNKAFSNTWNAKDQANGSIVADGIYTVRIEMSSEAYATSSKYITATITKGATAQTVTPTAVSPISAISIKWEPVTSAVNNVELEKMYNVYPNPAISSIYVSGNNIKDVEICSLTGRSIMTSKEQNVNISSLPKGMYLTVIRSQAGTIVKKIEKK